MMGALGGAAVWLNLATWLGAPVSTTHSIVGGVMGASIAAAGWDIVNWESVTNIAMAWVISPVTGGLIAAGLLYAMEHLVFFHRRPLERAQAVVPVMIALMAWAFTTYIAIKGIKKIVSIPFPVAMLLGAVAGVAVFFVVRPLIRRARARLTEDRDGVNRLFTIPLICGAALLSFAHGANDVANAVGPLAGVVDVLLEGEGGGQVAIPLWIMVIGALGISVGLALFGPKLIRTVGSEITELDRARAFCIALSAAITVIVASQLGLPISSTHVALGAVFGVGFLREWLEQRLGKVAEDVLAQHRGEPDFAEVERVLWEFRNAPPEEKRRILAELKAMGPEAVIPAAQRKELRAALKRQLVSRRSLLKIASAWVITLPVAAVLAAMFYFVLRGMLLP
jgi:PiT family inorganic phosphate transporter